MNRGLRNKSAMLKYRSRERQLFLLYLAAFSTISVPQNSSKASRTKFSCSGNFSNIVMQILTYQLLLRSLKLPYVDIYS